MNIITSKPQLLWLVGPIKREGRGHMLVETGETVACNCWTWIFVSSTYYSTVDIVLLRRREGWRGGGVEGRRGGWGGVSFFGGAPEGEISLFLLKCKPDLFLFLLN